VGAAQTVTVAGAQDVTVGAASAVFVGAAAALNVGGAYAVNVGGAVNELVAGLKSSQVAGEAVELVGAHREERIVGERVGTTQGDAQADIDGAVRVGADLDLTETVQGKVTIAVVDVARAEPAEGTLEASGGLKLVVGGNVVLAMTSGGEVQFAGAAITVDGSELALKGGTLKKISPDTATANTPSPGDVTFVEIELVDGDGAPVPHERFRVEFADGDIRVGRLDDQGRARVPGARQGTCWVSFPRLDADAWERE
jgi:hypothetical protein